MIKKILILLPCLLFCEKTKETTKLSEAVGHMIGKHIEKLGLEFDIDAVVQGLEKELLGEDSSLSEEELIRAIQNTQQQKILEMTESTLQKFDTLFHQSEVKRK